MNSSYSGKSVSGSFLIIVVLLSRFFLVSFITAGCGSFNYINESTSNAEAKNSTASDTAPMKHRVFISSADGLLTNPSIESDVVSREELAIVIGNVAASADQIEITGTCPQGSWSGNLYKTGTIIDDCTVNFSIRKVVPIFESPTVIISAASKFDGSITIPTPTVYVKSGQTYTYTGIQVGPGNTLDKTLEGISGSCPKGSWSAENYTTGMIIDSCTVIFSVSNITLSATSKVDGNITISNPTVLVKSGQTFTFTGIVARAGDTLDTTLEGISGSCPKGSWSEGNYTTGTLIDSCTVIFSTLNPCPTVIADNMTFDTDIKSIFDTAGCVLCHEATDYAFANYLGPNGFDLSLVKNQFGIANRNRLLVDPFKPLNSLVYLNISADPAKNVNSRMPYGMPSLYLSTLDESKICNWILQGAN